MDISKIWTNVAGKIADKFDRRDPDFYYIDLSQLSRAVEIIPNPMRILAGHEETSYKWIKLSHWVSSTITPDNAEKAVFGRLGNDIFSIGLEIQRQKQRQIIKIPGEPMDNLLRKSPPSP